MLLTLGGFATLFTSHNLLDGNQPQFKFSVLQVRKNKDKHEPETAQACSGNGDNNPGVNIAMARWPLSQYAM
jgi:hypothetical protein